MGGLTTAARNVISGNQSGGIVVYSPANLVEGDYIGTTADGDAPLPNVNGIVIQSSGNTIGGTDAGAGNVIAGNVASGGLLGGGQIVIIFANDNLVEGNDIGTDAEGAALAGETGAGVALLDGTGNTIGGTTAAARNVISGNAMGVRFDFDSSVNVVEGNFIGTDLTGTVANANGGDGIEVLDGSTANTIGGTVAAGTAGNVISGNTATAWSITGAGTTGNVVAGNLIGTDITGTAALGNGLNGVGIDTGASDNIIGGTTASARNIISANGNSGVQIIGANDNLVEGNYIGTDMTGTVGLGNNGVRMVAIIAGGIVAPQRLFRQHHRRTHRDPGHRRGQPDLGQHLRGRVDVLRGFEQFSGRQPDRHRRHRHGCPRKPHRYRIELRRGWRRRRLLARQHRG